MLRIAICEDLENDAEQLLSLVKQNKTDTVECFKSGEDFLKTFRAGRYDLIFMDIYMKGMRGIETVKVIRETDPDVMVVFTTSSPDHTRESYRLKAIRYLDKPLQTADVHEALGFALMQKKNRSVITLKEAGGRRKDVYLDSILYFEQQRYVILVHTTSGVIKTSQSARLDDFEKRLPASVFLRCHGSFLVNLDYVDKADKEIYAFLMKNGGRVHIRRGGFTACKNELEKRLMDKVWGNEG